MVLVLMQHFYPADGQASSVNLRIDSHENLTTSTSGGPIKSRWSVSEDLQVDDEEVRN